MDFIFFLELSKEAGSFIFLLGRWWMYVGVVDFLIVVVVGRRGGGVNVKHLFSNTFFRLFIASHLTVKIQSCSFN